MIKKQINKINSNFKLIFMTLFVIFIFSNAVMAFEISVNSYDPIPAEAGKPVNVWLKVENNDLLDVEQNVVIEITPKDGLTLSPGETSSKNVGTLNTGSTQIVKFRLFVNDDAYKGSHILLANVKSLTSSYKKELQIEVTDKDFKDIDLSVGKIESDPDSIKPNTDNIKLDVTLLNLGDGNAKGVKAELIDLPEGITLKESYSGTDLIGNLAADGSEVATFYIDVAKNVTPREYNSRIKVSYKYKPDETEDEYKFEEKQIPVKLVIKAIPLYEITNLELDPPILTAGDRKVKLKLTIKNIGEEEGNSVRIKVYGKTEQPITFQTSSDFVAPSLKPGESGQGSFEFNIDDDAFLQKYYLDLEIKNLVDDDVITYNEKIPIEILNPKPNDPWFYVKIGVGLIIIVGLYLGYTAIKNKNKKIKPTSVRGKYGKSYLDDEGNDK